MKTNNIYPGPHDLVRHWYPISYLTIASYGFFGRLRVPTRRCDLVVLADWGWGRSNKVAEVVVLSDMIIKHYA